MFGLINILTSFKKILSFIALGNVLPTFFILQVVWHPHNDVVASCSYDNKIKMYKEDDDDWVSEK
jgi:hypothetical protein